MNKKSTAHMIFALLVTAAMLFSACQTAVPQTGPGEVEPTSVSSTPLPSIDDATTPRYGGTLVAVNGSDLLSCNPSTNTQISWLPGNIFEGLTRYNGQFEMQPELANSWEISEDGLTITFNLRSDVKWHDGEPFTSEDVKFTFENVLREYHPRGRVSNQAVERIETPDDFTVVFYLSAPSPGFLFQIGIGESMIIPAHIYDNEDVNEGPHATCEILPIGTGPFKAESYNQGVSFTMVRNDDWWGKGGNYWGDGQPYLDRIIVTIIIDENARVNGFESGEFDFLPFSLIPAHEIKRFQAMEGRDITFSCTGVPTQTFLAFNLRRTEAPYANLKVRQAIAWAMDLDEYNERVYFDTGVPSRSFLPPTHPEYNQNLELYQPQDFSKAEQLLDEAGYPREANGVRFEMSVTADSSPVNADSAAVFAQQMDKIGIRVNLDINERNVHVDKVYVQHEFDANFAQLGVFDPSVGVARFFLSNNIGESHFNNASAYVNPEMDELWNIYSSSYDPEERMNAIHRIQEIIMEDLPVIYVNTPTNWMNINTEKFDGWPLDCTNMFNMLRTVWWKEGQPSP
jgi:peptide/nickel transport system substrate-binding protein